MAAEQIFFLNPLNRDFVLGRTPQLYRAPFAPLEAGCAFLFFTPFVLAGIAILVMAIASWYQFAAFSSAAVAVEATVIDKRIGTDSDGDDQFFVTYRFSVAGNADETSYTNEVVVNEQRYQQAEQGGSISIVYLPFDPAQNQVVGQNNLFLALFLTAFTLFWNAVVIGILCSFIGNMLRDVRLMRKGLEE